MSLYDQQCFIYKEYDSWLIFFHRNSPSLSERPASVMEEVDLSIEERARELIEFLTKRYASSYLFTYD